MAEINQFGSVQPGSAQVCGRCEALLMDVLDGVASAEDQSFFDAHVASCTGCSEMLADARRGAAWLEMLRDPRPEPSAALFETILAQTSGLGSRSVGIAEKLVEAIPSAPFHAQGMMAGVSGASTAYPFAGSSTGRSADGRKILPFRVRAVAHSMRQSMLQPRLAMTAAMAFFSIALTLNLTGVPVSKLRMTDLRPANLRRSFYQANAHVVRYCDNLRVVYELEARAHDLQRGSESDAQDSGSPARHEDAPSDAPKKPNEDSHGPGGQQAPPKPGPGTSRREPLTHDGLHVAALYQHASGASRESLLPLSSSPTDDDPGCVPAMHLKGDLA